ncbi:MAG: phospho-sugar mutase [Oscillospiraceae bacterium]|nr:phospho-sugar mutase [Oscillospiraceae bacterium]
MNAFEKYSLWLERLPEAEKAELRSIENSPDEITDRFYTDLVFGTGGLRGIVGLGTNRMNKYTVGSAAQGLADWLYQTGGAKKVAIARDSRNFSLEFSRITAAVLAENGIEVYFFNEIAPTPMLSFAVRYLGCGAGVMITASHNPREYNGFKCYGPDGGQMTDKGAGEVLALIEKNDLFTAVRHGDFDALAAEGKIVPAPGDIFDAYIKNAVDMSLNPQAFSAGLRVLYTPLNGAGKIPVTTALKMMGLEHLDIVPSQAEPDGQFPTCPYPNPEMRPAFDEAMKIAAKTRPELVFATDPDSDRLACAVERDGEYIFLTGNEVGSLFCNYLLSQLKEKGRLPENPLIIKTIVSSHLPDRICRQFGCQVLDVLTGFKYVAGEMLKMENDGTIDRFIMGFEESVGYLFGPNVRDKDAVAASLLLCEMASFYKLQSKTLADVMDDIYRMHGRFFHKTLNLTFKGAEGKETMAAIMDNLRRNTPSEIGGRKVLGVEDYLPGLRGLPPSNVLIFDLGEGYSAIARPSGTEPKLKFYLTAVGDISDDGETLLADIAAELEAYCK